MNEPQISLAGNLAFDPEVRYTPTGIAVVDLRVACTRRYKMGEEWIDGETLWFDVACWKQVAEHAAASLKKGDKVTVAGRLVQKTWTREDGSSTIKLVIDASAVGVDLSRYPVRVEKPIRPGSAAEAIPDRWATPWLPTRAPTRPPRAVTSRPPDRWPLAPGCSRRRQGHRVGTHEGPRGRLRPASSGAGCAPPWSRPATRSGR